MPHPFDAMPTLAQFVDRVARMYHVTRGTSKTSLSGPRGTTQVDYLCRDLNGQTLMAPLQDIDPQTPLAPSNIRRLCDELRIPRSEFGITLDALESYTFGRY